jgi:outer membrane protein OmpA-like peptidoglycan-associated protein
MVKFLLTFSIFALWLIWARHYYICQVKGLCFDAVPGRDEQKFRDVAHSLSLKADEIILLENYPQVMFDDSSPQPIFDPRHSHDSFFLKIAQLMQQQPQTNLLITARYLQSEKWVSQNKGKFADLGQARAVSIANKLVQEFQIAPERLQTFSVKMIQDTLRDALDFNLLNYKPNQLADNNPNNKPKTDTSLLNQAKNSITDVTYYDQSTNFDSGSQTFKPNQDFYVYSDSLKSYFKNRSTQKLIITGHTDTKGDEKFNYQLGLKRANAVRQFLQKQGITIKIETQSKGETETVVNDQNADGSLNETAAAQNRRVNLKIVK